MLLIKILIAINILYLIIEDFRTKTVNVYYCISLFMLSSIYAVFSDFNIVSYLNNLLSGTLFLVFIYVSSIKLKNRNNITLTNEDNILDKGLSYLPIIFLGYVMYKILNFNDMFINYLATFQMSMDFLALPLCIIACLVIFMQILRCYFKSNKQIITSMGDGDIWAMMGIVGFIPLGEFFIIIFLANITFILIYTTRRFLCS
jgi:hypothetical protein